MEIRRVLFLFFLLAVVLGAPRARSQIVNIAPSLTTTEKDGISGNVEGEFSWRTGNTKNLETKELLALRFRHDRHHLYLIAAGRYGEADHDAFESALMEHLRYRYGVTDWLGADAFTQHEFNEFRRLRVRILTGTGPRFILNVSETLNFTIGTAYMLEFEQLDHAVDAAGNQLPDSGREEVNHRWSSFLGWSLKVTERFELAHANYLQPRFDDLSDFRFLSELSVRVDLVGTLALKVSASIAYDNRPALDVEKLDTYIGNSLSFTF